MTQADVVPPSPAPADLPIRSRNLITPDGVALVARLVTPPGGAARAAFVAHGQAQHSLSLARILQGLAAQGWQAHATDLRGHGQSASARAPRAHMDVGSGWDRLVGDLRLALAAAFDGVAWEDRLVVAPNIGAALALEVLRQWPDLARQIVLVAPPANNRAALTLARSFMAARVRLRPATAPDELALHQLYAFLGAQLPDRRGPGDVITSDRALAEAILSDPQAWTTPTSGYFHEFFHGIRRAWAAPVPEPARAGTRVLILYGSEDPVTASGQFVAGMRTDLARFGLCDVACHEVTGGRAGLILEEDRFGLARLITGWAEGAGLPGGRAPAALAAAATAPPDVTGRVLDRLGVGDPGPALAEDALVELCYTAIDDETRWIELMYRLTHALEREEGLAEAQVQAMLAALMPHWDRSYALTRQIAQAAAVGTVLQNVIDRFHIGVAIVDGDLNVLFANAAFGPGLGAGTAEGAAPLSARLRALADPAFLGQLREGAREALLMRDGALLGYWFRPPALRQTGLQRGGAAGVVILRGAMPDEAARQAALIEMLQFAHGLTRKEAETALGLIDGLGAEGIAARLDVSINTVRTHLKRVYEKIGVQSQTELVALLLRGPIGLLAGRMDR